MQLLQRIFDKIEELGTASAAAYFNRTETTIKKWLAGSGIPDVQAGQKVLDEALASRQLVEGGPDAPPVFDTPPPQGKTIPDQGPTTKKPETELAPPAEPYDASEVADQPLAPKVDLVRAFDLTKKHHLLIPTNRDMSHAVFLSAMGNWKATLPEEIRSLLAPMDVEYDTVIHHARNLLATRFLAKGSEWSFWLDSDMITPIGNPGWFKRRTGRSSYTDELLQKAAIERLTTRGKSFVGSVYTQRSLGGKLISQPGLGSKGAADVALCESTHKGPQDKIVPVDWVGFGCTVVHRRVFLDILERIPGVKSEDEKKPHNFFGAIEGGPSGEDIAFAKRAKDAGHQCYMDLGTICGHIGKYCFMP